MNRTCPYVNVSIAICYILCSDLLFIKCVMINICNVFIQIYGQPTYFGFGPIALNACIKITLKTIKFIHTSMQLYIHIDVEGIVEHRATASSFYAFFSLWFMQQVGFYGVVFIDAIPTGFEVRYVLLDWLLTTNRSLSCWDGCNYVFLKVIWVEADVTVFT